MNKPVNVKIEVVLLESKKMNKKYILDVTCGGRMIWFNKDHPNAIYTDQRKTERGLDPNRPNFQVKPDQIMNFKDLQFPDKSFKMVIFDPPHLKGISENSVMGKKYGSLDDNWREEIRKGFDECWRVLEDFGTLIFKWSCSQEGRKNRDIRVSEVLKILPIQPIVGHTTGSKSNTMWMSFLKIPESEIFK